MYKGKHRKREEGNNLFKSSALMFSVIGLTLCIVGTSLAYIIAKSEPLENIFNPSKVACSVEETISGTTKSDVKITNTGNTDAYIRAMVVVTWKDITGNVYGTSQPVAGTNYNISYNLSNSGWAKSGDGFYYYDDVVAAGGSTADLIDSCSLTNRGDVPAEYNLSVEIIADAVQESATNEAWGYTPSRN